jgi:hypothetical protein
MARQSLAWAAATVAVAVALTAGGFGYYAYAGIGAAVPAPAAFPEPRQAVEAVRLQGGEWAAPSCTVGTLVPLRHVAIVVETGFAAGDMVQAGQPGQARHPSGPRNSRGRPGGRRSRGGCCDRRDRLRAREADPALVRSGAAPRRSGA